MLLFSELHIQFYATQSPRRFVCVCVCVCVCDPKTYTEKQLAK